MIISIVNSRYGPNDRQIDSFRRFLSHYSPTTDEFSHGMEHSDRDIHSIISTIGFTVNGYPIANSQRKIDFKGLIKTSEALPLNKRNEGMIDNSQVVLGIPQSMNGHEDSPCWKTLRAAIAKEKTLFIISPEGYIYSFVR